MFDLVHFETSDNLILHGLYIAPQNNNPTIIHIHGWCGNFFQNLFFEPLARKLSQIGYGFLSIRTRGSEGRISIQKSDNSWFECGAQVHKVEEAHIDITAAIDFLKKQNHHNIILSGHSLGTMKIVRYLFEGKYKSEIKKLILISPFDNGFIKHAGSIKAHQEKLTIAQEKIKQGQAFEYVPKGFTYTPMSWQTFYSWGTLDDFGKMWNFSEPDYNFPILNKINIPVRTIIGNLDEHLDDKPQAMNLLNKHIKDFNYKIIPNANHAFWKCEEQVAEEIVGLIKT